MNLFLVQFKYLINSSNIIFHSFLYISNCSSPFFTSFNIFKVLSLFKCQYRENIKSLKLNVLIGNWKESKRSTWSCDFTAFIKLILLLLSLNITELNLTWKEEIIKRKVRIIWRCIIYSCTV